MNSHSMPTFIKRSIMLTLVLTLSACGGSGSDSYPSNPIPADFDLFSQTGTWRMDIDTRLNNLAFSLNFDGQTITRSIDLTLDMLTVGSLAESGDQVISDICGVAPAETLDKTDFAGNSIADFTDDLDLDCSLSVTYTRVSDSNYQISALVVVPISVWI